MKIIVRPFDREKDSGLIFDSYPKGVYYGSLHPITDPKNDWMKLFFEMLKRQLASAQILIACTEDDPDTILGYSIVENGTLNFVYVKGEFRKKGIGNLLTKDKFINVNSATLTKIGAAILSKQRKE